MTQLWRRISYPKRSTLTPSGLETFNASVVELVDTADLESVVARRGSSSLSRGTNIMDEHMQGFHTYFTNEIGNKVSVGVDIKGDEYTIVTEGPTSKSENTLTREEFLRLFNVMARFI